MDLIPEYIEGGWSSEEVAKGIQAYLICVEMFAAAIVHTFVFPHTDYMRPIVTSKTPVGAANFGRKVNFVIFEGYKSISGGSFKNPVEQPSPMPVQQCWG